VGSLLQSKRMVSCVFAILLVFSSSLHAAENANYTPIDPMIEGYYPTYPPITPPPGISEKLAKRGEYLVKLGDCISCHTDVKAGTPVFAGGFPIETPYGTIYTPNITGDKKTGIGKWTDEDFIHALKEGKNPGKGANYIPAFPYVFFSNVTDDDARAIFAYLKSVPPVVLENKAPPFPFNMPGLNVGMKVWNLLFFYPNEPYQYNSDQSAQWNRGKYIVDGLGHCSMCHTPMNILGGWKNRFYLTGSLLNGYWAPNITQFGLKSASRYEVADVFNNGELINKAGPVSGPMAEVNHNSLTYLTEDDRIAIATYLKTVVSEEPFGISPSEKQPTLRRGKQVYVNACIICHQDGVMTAPLIGDGANWFMRLKSTGLNGLYRHAVDGYNSMPVKGACVTCSDNDIAAAVDYILSRSLSRSQWIDVKTNGQKKFPTSGKLVYKENCSVCHEDGKLGAPKIGDKQVWAPLIAQNIDVLVENTINGIHHHKNGGCKKCSTAEVIDAIKYMVSQSKTEGNYSLW